MMNNTMPFTEKAMYITQIVLSALVSLLYVISSCVTDTAPSRIIYGISAVVWAALAVTYVVFYMKTKKLYSEISAASENKKENQDERPES